MRQSNIHLCTEQCKSTGNLGKKGFKREREKRSKRERGKKRRGKEKGGGAITLTVSMA